MPVSEPSGRDPTPQSHDPNPPESDHLAADNLPPDPLLKSGAYIDVNLDPAELSRRAAQNGDVQHREPNRTEPREPDHNEPSLRTRPVADVSSCADGPTAVPVAGTTAESLPSRLPRRVPDVAAALPERPDWLPEGWGMDFRVRSSGASAGSIDRYYVEPVAGRRFRSKKEVLHFLETGSMRKRKLNPDADAMSSESPVSHKQKNIGARTKSPAPLNFDFNNVPEEVTWVLTDASEGVWTAFIGDEEVPEATQREWAAAFEFLNTRKSGGTMY